ncbi:MAG TPA: cytochrome ubiquinol oxidase subunit I, partial [Ramlibacter sp.]|nr:cytochrome ubiquinol oxidase subunit I [Ramlibacter sp.]
GRTVLDGPLLDRGRDTFGTSPLDAQPDEVLRMPEDTAWPFVLSLSILVFCYGALFGLFWLMAVGVIGLFVSIIGWLQPSHEPAARLEA